MEPYGEAWAGIARSLGLALHEPRGAYSEHLTFRTLKMLAGPPARMPAPTHWICGRDPKSNVEIVIAPRVLATGSTVALVARIDPPLFLGLSAVRRQDRWFDVLGWDRERAKNAFAMARGPLEALSALSPSVRIQDSTVAVDVPGYTDLSRMLETCTSAARALSSIRGRLARTEAELAQEATWRAFADTMSLRFDVDRMEISGAVLGAKLRVVLESDPRAAFTTLIVDFPGHVGLSLSVTKQRGPAALNALTGVVDLPTGDVLFDDAFVVTGAPAVAVQRLLWDPTLRHAIDDLGRAALHFELGDAHLHARYVSPLAAEGELGRLLECVATVVRTLFPSVGEREGPYR